MPFLKYPSSFNLGNQSQVLPVPVNKPYKSAAANQSFQPSPVRDLVPTGRAPGPAGSGKAYKPPPNLKITLPKENTAPLALAHYEAVRKQLRDRIEAGGQDAVTIVIDARLTTQEPGRVQPTVINVSVFGLCESCFRVTLTTVLLV